ncbi:MAG: FixH family protein [Methyloceanibacter sp.]
MSLRTILAAQCFVAALVTGTVAQAAADDYSFEPVQVEVKRGDGVTVAVRLIDKATKKPVPDAVIIEKRIDMAPEDMASMDSPLTAVPSEEPGVYAFKTDLTMAGRWRLSLAARVQGEPETVKSEVVFKATP